MIDIHCHILPKVDDGAKDLEDAIKMAKIAQDEGIKKIINTSHYHPNFDYIMGEKLLKSVEEFNNILKKNNIDVEVLIGNELYYSENLLEYIDKKKFYTLNNSKYILVEFSPTMFPKNLCEVVYELKLRGYVPILAHIERYKEIQENLSLVNDAIKEGALIQVNTSSVLGKGPKAAKNICEMLLKYNKVHFIATDAHGNEKRRPHMKECYEYVVDKYGQSRANKLFIQNPNSIINNEEIVFEAIEKVDKKRNRFLSKIFRGLSI